MSDYPADLTVDIQMPLFHQLAQLVQPVCGIDVCHVGGGTKDSRGTEGSDSD